MAKIAFHLNMNKKDKNDFVPIRAKISVQSKAVVKNLPFKVKVKKNNETGKYECTKWNEEKQRLSATRENEKYNGFKEINKFLDDYTSKANKLFNDCILNDTPLTIDLVKKFFNGEAPNFNPVKMDFWTAYEEFLKIGELTFEPNTIRSRKSKKVKLEKFQNETGYKMTFENITLDFFDKLKEYMLFTKLHEYNYFPAIIKQIKAFMNWSFERNYHKNTSYKKFSAPEKEGSIIYLTFQELQDLINFPFESKKLQRVRDFYCFGCLTGARYSDLKLLTKDNISDGMLKFTTKKTNNNITIPMFPGLASIIDRYPEQHKLLPEYSVQKACDYIKDACELAGIKTPTEYKTFLKNETITEFKPKHQLIGTHTARKTFICLAHAKGVDIKTIMDITGIKDENTLRRYLDVSIDTKLNNLTNMFEDLTPKEEQELNPNNNKIIALKEALLKKGLNGVEIDDLLSQIKG
jgi:integrase